MQKTCCFYTTAGRDGCDKFHLPLINKQTPTTLTLTNKSLSLGLRPKQFALNFFSGINTTIIILEVECLETKA